MDNNTEIIARLVSVEDGVKENRKHIDIHDKQIKELQETNAILKNMDYRMGKVEESVEKIDKKIDDKVEGDLGDKGKKYDKFIDYIFYTILGLLLGYIAIKLGLK